MPLRLYDLCGADDLRFSPYCARAKMALALKGLAYETVPVPFTGIAAIAGGGHATVPVLEDGDRRVSDSFAIAEYLEDRHPEPPIFAPGPAGRAAARFVEGALFGIVHAAAMPIVGKTIHDRLQPADQPYFRETREAKLGRSLEAAHADRESRLPEARKLFFPLRHTLARSAWFGGDRPLYVDAVVYGTAHWLHAVNDADWFAGDPTLTDWFERCRAIVGAGAPA
ncbi:glutathione S-transferase N-terminal domain-containing protein [Chthonobacter rhizosphaerae]|uniref:glutathione S-transferase N-terminal domain-containing protein n=1 Tax=Chthonobacter rhizosphaerae TaxID=2735553 RepID=UPI0015EF849E|nr:glutathione S-transferase N-terminal domain-containing protein [Chthonobacter rhizosphaerae]